jgi:hypothetical protein
MSDTSVWTTIPLPEGKTLYVCQSCGHTLGPEAKPAGPCEGARAVVRGITTIYIPCRTWPMTAEEFIAKHEEAREETDVVFSGKLVIGDKVIEVLAPISEQLAEEIEGVSAELRILRAKKRAEEDRKKQQVETAADELKRKQQELAKQQFAQTGRVPNPGLGVGVIGSLAGKAPPVIADLRGDPDNARKRFRDAVERQQQTDNSRYGLQQQQAQMAQEYNGEFLTQEQRDAYITRPMTKAERDVMDRISAGFVDKDEK